MVEMDIPSPRNMITFFAMLVFSVRFRANLVGMGMLFQMLPLRDEVDQDQYDAYCLVRLEYVNVNAPTFRVRHVPNLRAEQQSERPIASPTFNVTTSEHQMRYVSLHEHVSIFACLYRFYLPIMTLGLASFIPIVCSSKKDYFTPVLNGARGEDYPLTFDGTNHRTFARPRPSRQQQRHYKTLPTSSSAYERR
uniref:Uncharacterized protein n=1 Tax=Anopheles farauti TaxID=69004 RepID=A0A182Q0F5_9DIPT